MTPYIKKADQETNLIDQVKILQERLAQLENPKLPPIEHNIPKFEINPEEELLLKIQKLQEQIKTKTETTINDEMIPIKLAANEVLGEQKKIKTMCIIMVVGTLLVYGTAAINRYIGMVFAVGMIGAATYYLINSQKRIVYLTNKYTKQETNTKKF
jgi:hypothetical protein